MISTINTFISSKTQRIAAFFAELRRYLQKQRKIKDSAGVMQIFPLALTNTDRQVREEINQKRVTQDAAHENGLFL